MMCCGLQTRDAERIRDFILEHKPHALLVGGANMACRQLKAELTAVRDYILETMPHFFTRCAACPWAARHAIVRARCGAFPSQHVELSHLRRGIRNMSSLWSPGTLCGWYCSDTGQLVC